MPMVQNESRLIGFQIFSRQIIAVPLRWIRYLQGNITKGHPRPGEDRAGISPDRREKSSWRCCFFRQPGEIPGCLNRRIPVEASSLVDKRFRFSLEAYSNFGWTHRP